METCNCEKKYTEDDLASAVCLFIAQCGEMAEQNWTPAQVQMLKWLMGAVISGTDYADYVELEKEEGQQA